MRPFYLSDEEIRHIQERRELDPTYQTLLDRQQTLLSSSPARPPATQPILKAVPIR